MDVTHILEPLNDRQREAVTAPAEPTLVLAGAGSGKTRVLVHRAAWLIEAEGVSPHGLLAVTFTNKAAAEMRGRIGDLLGTSAGAAFLSEHMIAFGDEGSSPRGDMVTLAPGLGLTSLAIIDQHFRQRDRLGRLLTALAYNPEPIGIGLDEDTAAFIGPDETLEVVGSGAITVVDPSDIEFTSMDSASRHDPVCVIGARLHVLIDGATYNIESREALEPGRLAEERTA